MRQWWAFLSRQSLISTRQRQIINCKRFSELIQSSLILSTMLTGNITCCWRSCCSSGRKGRTLIGFPTCKSCRKKLIAFGGGIPSSSKKLKTQRFSWWRWKKLKYTGRVWTKWWQFSECTQVFSTNRNWILNYLNFWRHGLTQEFSELPTYPLVL